ncbi:Phage Terminase [uncultured archaeon]|nr:Phage Terminase [uncultured archaeon]
MPPLDYTIQPNAAETALKYAQDVLSGAVVAGRLVRLACERFLLDLQNQKEFYFDPTAAQHAVDFFGFLKHTKGAWSKKKETAGFVLSSWQVFVVANLFGWINRVSGCRRFREAYIEVARKNGKSTFIAGIGLYCLLADGEPGAEVYSAATTKEQAKRIFDPAKEMVKVSPYLSSRVGVFRSSLSVEATFSKFLPLASESNTLDGLNISCGLVDELHEHPDRSLYDVLNTATGSRSQPLLIEITTAGFQREGICWDQREHGVKVVARKIVDDNFFAYIACLDDEDDWKDKTKWVKANPNLGISTSIAAIEPNFVKALEQPAAQNEFLRKHMNKWTAQNTAMLAEGKWEKCCAAGEHANPGEQRELAFKHLKGRRCVLGLDMASTDDLVALAAVFPPSEQVTIPDIPAGHNFIKMAKDGEVKCLPENNILNLIRLGAGQRTEEIPQEWLKDPAKFKVLTQKDDKWSLLVWYWMPEAFVLDKEKSNRFPYSAWVRNKFIETCPGLQIDQQMIRNKVLELNAFFRVTELGYDLWNTGWLGPKLVEDGIKAVKIPQKFEFLDGPTKMLVNLITGGVVEHYNDPVLKWMVSNVQLLLDSNGNQRPDKAKSKNKIDGYVACVMAMNRAMANPQQQKLDDPNRFKVHYI